jgi:threonine aldolase
MYEAGGYAVLAGCSISLVEGERGQMSPEDVQRAIRKVAGSDSHYPECTLICVENTANVGGGSIYDQETLDAICEVAHKNDCRAHMDGARMFNAVVASGTDPARMVRDFDTISICLSKGLGAPIGSVLVGDAATIAEAHRWRKMFGGGMRQSGILAAAGLYALENNIDRLEEDHARARRLAEALDAMEAYSIDLGAVQSNMVYINCKKDGAKTLVNSLAEMGVDVLDLEQGVDYGDISTVRAVVHLHITDEDIDRVIAAFDAAQ